MAQLTTTEAAQRLGVSDARIRQLILEGRLPAEKKGRDHFIEEKYVTKMISEREARLASKKKQK